MSDKERDSIQEMEDIQKGLEAFLQQENRIFYRMASEFPQSVMMLSILKQKCMEQEVCMNPQI